MITEDQKQVLIGGLDALANFGYRVVTTNELSARLPLLSRPASDQSVDVTVGEHLDSNGILFALLTERVATYLESSLNPNPAGVCGRLCSSGFGYA